MFQFNCSVGLYILPCFYDLHTVPVSMPCVSGTTLYPTSANGTITSMNYPNNYINNANCAFIITASSPYKVRKILFVIHCCIPD